MSLHDAMQRALDEAQQEGAEAAGGRKLRASAGGKKAEVHLLDVDRIGVKVRRVRVSRDEALDVAKEAVALPQRARSLPDPVVPIEVDRELGQAILRTDPDQLRRREFFEVDVRAGGDVDVQRFKVSDGGERDRIDWTMTREQLGRLLDEL